MTALRAAGSWSAETVSLSLETGLSQVSMGFVHVVRPQGFQGDTSSATQNDELRER